MDKLRIIFDFSHGPIWKDKYDIATGEWSTGIEVIDNDKALSILNEEAEKEYSSLYFLITMVLLILICRLLRQKREAFYP